VQCALVDDTYNLLKDAVRTQKIALLFREKAAVPAMIFRQLFDSVSGTYSYLLASRAGGEALILDPVLEKVDRYCQLLRELDLRLVKAVDTHLHADHIWGSASATPPTRYHHGQKQADVWLRVSATAHRGLSLDVMPPGPPMIRF
jgi:glyoxylase-like metal-dependent hydrolase (beta-lactamase superfamily II)